MIPLLVSDWRSLRRRNVMRFIRVMSERHPELRSLVGWTEFQRMAEREGITIEFRPLSRPSRLIRFGARVAIQFDKKDPLRPRATDGMHELCHFWRDDPGVACYFLAEDGGASPSEEFANIFAWFVTSSARQFVPGLREVDF